MALLSCAWRAGAVHWQQEAAGGERARVPPVQQRAVSGKGIDGAHNKDNLGAVPQWPYYTVHGAQALSIGSRRQLAVSVRECGLCSGELPDFQALGSAPASMGAAPAALGGDATVQLSCKHCFHDQVALPSPWPAALLGLGPD